MRKASTSPAPSTAVCWIVEDQTMLRQLLHAVVTDTGLFGVIAEFSDAESALRSLENEPPGFAMIDLVLPGMGGIDLLEMLAKRSPSTRILVVSDRLEPVLIRHALARGAHGCINKGMPVEVLKTAIQRILKGETFICPITRARLNQEANSPDASHFEMLTKQERRILRLHAQGQSAKQLASELGISSGTASNHLTSIRQKLGVADGVSLVRIASDHGLIPPLR